MTGTLLNAGAVLAGTLLGVLVGDRLPPRIRETVFHALGLLTLLIGVANGLEAFGEDLGRATAAGGVVVLASVLVGGILGELLRIEDGLNRIGETLRRRFGKGQAKFTEGFVVASLVFCVGPLAILGSLADGLRGDIELLAIKSLLDGFAAIGFASALGWGVGFSILTILIYQGAISLSASYAASLFTPGVTAALTGAGGLLILGLGLRLLELKEVRVANLLPALVIAPVAVALLER
ncbi:MAG TPA: DUF554 domain-containing protein [Actinomycetota bacterium]|nr:DUF554 domain-containing protein [Actinomycetota bacterium]